MTLDHVSVCQLVMCVHILHNCADGCAPKTSGGKMAFRVLFDTQFTQVDFSVSNSPFKVLETSVKVENRENVPGFVGGQKRSFYKSDLSYTHRVKTGFPILLFHVTTPNFLMFLILICCLTSQRNERWERETYFHGLQLVQRRDPKE